MGRKEFAETKEEWKVVAEVLAERDECLCELLDSMKVRVRMY